MQKWYFTHLTWNKIAYKISDMETDSASVSVEHLDMWEGLLNW